jgi:uncharacterized protein (DUF305 family)
MPKNIITLFSIIVLIVGFAIGYSFGLNKSSVTDIDSDNKIMTDDDNDSMGHMMSDMSAGLNGKTGDEFDKAFIEEMIVHHQGAVDMANLALKNAKHKEILDLSRAIIRAQNEEITDMQNWKKAWFNNK